MPTIGLFGLNMGPCAAPEPATRFAVLAEQLGYDSLWMGEHVVAPSPRVPPSMIEPRYPILDPFLTLAHVAATTRRVQLATGIVIVPQRNPVVLAKEIATLDVLSGGRFMLGIGVGYVEPEMRAIGVPMEGRGARTDEYLQAMRSLWSDDTPSFNGTYAAFDGVEAHPQPVQQPIPVVVGGDTPAAHRRAARLGDGWYGWMLDREATARSIESLRREAEAAGRNIEDLEISVTPSEQLDAPVIDDYEELGVDRLVMVPPRGFWRVPVGSPEAFEEFLRANAPAQRRSASVRTIAS